MQSNYKIALNNKQSYNINISCLDLASQNHYNLYFLLTQTFCFLFSFSILFSFTLFYFLFLSSLYHCTHFQLFCLSKLLFIDSLDTFFTESPCSQHRPFSLYRTALHHQFFNQITQKTKMSVSPQSAQKPQGSLEISSQPTYTAIGLNGSPKILTNLILKLPPQSQNNLDVPNFPFAHQLVGNYRTMPISYTVGFDKFAQNRGQWRPGLYGDIKQEEDLRVKGKVNKKGKRDGENIRTYARYDSVIQALQQELQKHNIVPTIEDNKMLDKFEMKSKRSLQRFFFYLLLAKRQNKLQELLPNLKLKIRAKVQQKGGHRTSQFLNSLQSCIQKYIDAAEKLQEAKSIQQAKIAFSIAYLSDLSQNGNQKRPHHNKVKGIQNCLQIYRIIIGREESKEVLVKEQAQGQKSMIQLLKKQLLDNTPVKKQNKQIQPEKPVIKTQKKKQYKVNDDESFIIEEDQMRHLIENPNEKKKKLGVKNKKQDDRDIQKYAKFDIVSQSSLQFLKIQKLHKNILEVCKKLSQRSLHFFFVILAMIQKQKKDAQFLAHLEDNYERKVQKRYSQRSQYFRTRLHQSFFNLIQATRALFQGKLEEALDIAYEVKADKKPHPAKASQQKKCRQIYEAIRSSFMGSEQQNKLKLQLLIQRDKGHRSQLIKHIKCPTTKAQAQKDLDRLRMSQQIQPKGIQMLIRQPQGGLQCKIQQQCQFHQRQLQICDRIHRQSTGILIPVPQRSNQQSSPVLGLNMHNVNLNDSNAMVDSCCNKMETS